MTRIALHVEVLEPRIAPDIIGTGGYDGQPGNQSNSQGNPSGSANPEVPGGKNPQPGNGGSAGKG